MAQLLSNLPVGAKVKFGKYSVNGEPAQSITWLIVAKNHDGTPAYPTNSCTLLTEKLIDMRAFDAREVGSDHGSSNYSVSNIDQWLNSDAKGGEWFVAKHSFDNAPTNDNVGNGTGYAHRPGFLNAFSNVEKNNILTTNIRVRGGDGSEDIIRKVFLPSTTELGTYVAPDAIKEGAKWAYFKTILSETSLTEQAFQNSLSTSKPSSVETLHYWWTRSRAYSDSTRIVYKGHSSETVAYPCDSGDVGVRPALNLSSSVKVTDTTDGENCYTVLLNSAPPNPQSLTPPSVIYGGKSNLITWSTSIDLDGDIVTYQLECSLNGGAYTQIYNGTGTSYTHLVPFGTTSVAYRVKATDPSGESSTYKTSTIITVVNNNAPVISGSDGNLGVKSSGFTGTYTITDANNNAVTVTESIDGIQIRAFVATLWATNTYGITGNTWLALPNGSHTLTIRATDGIDSTVRTYTFTKLVESFTIQNSTPWAASTMPSRIMLVITRNIPSTSTFKVEVCNNGYDASPKWEDCTDAVKSGLVHVFTNTTKTASNWGVLVRVTVGRNGATGACYISAIGGNFE